MRHWILERMPRNAAISGLVLLAFLMQGMPAANAQPAANDDDDAQAAARYAQQSLRVNVWVDKGANEVYARGEALQVNFQVNEDAYVVVYHVDVNGRVSVLWPTSRYSDGFAFGQHEYRLPTDGGARLRTAEVEGVGYVNALASRYPYDLRDLDVDFYQEPQDPARDFYVAGDPFLAMNEVNYAVTGLEDTSEYVVSNYTSYYVHRPVDHPRYLCAQCHQDGDLADHPYDSECSITIRYDYDWSNEWWDRYGYYPTYYYPVYVYIDPWSGSPWVNYWYRPWYRWPYSDWYRWDYACYDWHYSPYWQWDCDGGRDHGPRRYRPLDKTDLARGGSPRGAVNTRSGRVTDASPGDVRVAAMKERTVVRDRRAVDQRAEARDPQRASGGESLRNVAPTTRANGKFSRGEEPRSGSGLRIPEGRDSGVRRGDAGSRGTGRSADIKTPTGSTRGSGRENGARSGDEVRIRPVEPREGTPPTWSGRRGSSSREVVPAKPAEPTRDGSRSRVEKKDNPRGSTGRNEAPPPRSGGNDERSSGDRGSSGGGDSRGESRGGNASGGNSSGGNSGGNSGGGDRGGNSSGGSGRTRGGR
jgi:hypothetical protein